MDYIAVKLSVDGEHMDVLTNALEMQGFTEFEVEDPRDFDYLFNGHIYYDYIDDEVLQRRENCSITVYLPENTQGEERKSLLINTAQGLQIPKLHIGFTLTREEDWANNWKSYFKPIPVGETLIIKPSWEELPPGNTRKVLEIDPSTSFGTGTHATTRLCLELLESEIAGGEDVLDMGCGSGILGVGARLLGAHTVCAVDIEQNALEVTKENAVRNHVFEGFTLYTGNVLADDALFAKVAVKKYDVIVANIVADVIIAMSEMFKLLIKPGGKLFCSGIISERADEVGKALKTAGFTLNRTLESEDWVALYLTV